MLSIYEILMHEQIRCVDMTEVRELLPKMGVPGNVTGLCIADTAHDPIIAIDTQKTRRERRFTAAHELGHALLGHVEFRANSDGSEFETEANIFASVFVAGCVLLEAYDRQRDGRRCEGEKALMHN